MAGTAPFSLVNGPVEIYYGNVGQAAPEIDLPPPSGNWTLLGTSGSDNYGEDGVTCTPIQSYEHQMVLGSTAPQKAYRTEEGFTISVPLVDMTAEALAAVMNFQAVTDVSAGNGTGGHRSLNLLRGSQVAEKAILVRGKSPYIAGDNATAGNAQHHIPRAYCSDVGEYTFAKGEGAMTEVEFTALEHSTMGFGKYYAQDADAT